MKRKHAAMLRFLVLTAGAAVMIYPLLWLIGATFRTNTELFSSAGIIPQSPVTDGWASALKAYGGQIHLLAAMKNTYLLAIP